MNTDTLVVYLKVRRSPEMVRLHITCVGVVTCYGKIEGTATSSARTCISGRQGIESSYLMRSFVHGRRARGLEDERGDLSRILG